MKKYIHVTKEVRQELAKVFNVGDRTVRNALLFDKDRGDTDCAKRIRMFALQKGGIVMAVVPEVEVLYDYDGMISQYFPNGAKLDRRERHCHGHASRCTIAGCSNSRLFRPDNR